MSSRITVSLAPGSINCYRWDYRNLCPDERPIGGSKPFFQPDFCPGPNDFVSHKYRLTISNLSQHEHPSLPVVGEIFFTQYTPPLLQDTYAYENGANDSALAALTTYM